MTGKESKRIKAAQRAHIRKLAHCLATPSAIHWDEYDALERQLHLFLAARYRPDHRYDEIMAALEGKA